MAISRSLIVSEDSKISWTSAGYFGTFEPNTNASMVVRVELAASRTKGLIGPEAAALLGSLFVAELWQAVLGRARVPAERRHPVVVYADEFQDYVHLPTDMADHGTFFAVLPQLTTTLSHGIASTSAATRARSMQECVPRLPTPDCTYSMPSGRMVINPS